MSERIDLEIQAKIEKFRAEMGKIPGITAQAADKSAAALQKGLYVQAAKDAAGLGKANASVADNVAKSWSDVGKKVSSLAGGPFAQFGDAIFELVPKAGQASAALGGVAIAGAGLAGAVVVAGALAMASKAMADAAVEARDRLKEQGLAAMLPHDALVSLQDYEEANKDLRREVDLLTVAVGSEFAPALTDAAHATVGLIDALGSVAVGTKAVYDTFEPIREIAGWISPISWELWAVEKAFGALAAKGEAHVETTKTQVRAIVSLQDAEKARIAAMIEHGKDEERVEKASAKAGTDARKATEAAEAELLKALEADKAGYYERVNAMHRGSAASVLAMEEEAAAQARAITEATIASQVEAFQAGTDGIIAEIDKQLKAYEDAAAKKKAADEAAKQFAMDSIGALSDVYDEFGKLGVENAEKQAKAGKISQRDLAIYQKKVAVTSAILSSITAIAAAIASAPPPFNIPAIATATVTSGIQIGKASSAKIPSLFGGGMDRGDGEGVALLHKGEGVLNARAMDQLVRALNQGLSPLRGLAGAGAGGGPADVYLDGRQVGRSMARAARSGRGVSTGPPPGYVRRRG